MLSALPFLICALALSLPIAFAVAKAVCEGMEKTALKEMSRVRNSLKSLNAGEFEPLPTDGVFASEFAEINALNKNTQKTTARKARDTFQFPCRIGGSTRLLWRDIRAYSGYRVVARYFYPNDSRPNPYFVAERDL